MPERVPVNDNEPLQPSDFEEFIREAADVSARYRTFVGTMISNAQDSAPAQVQALRDVYRPITDGFPHAIYAAQAALSALRQLPADPPVERAAAAAWRNLHTFVGTAKRHMGEE